MRSQFSNAWHAITSGNASSFNKKYGVVPKGRKTRRVNRKGRKTRRVRRH